MTVIRRVVPLALSLVLVLLASSPALAIRSNLSNDEPVRVIVRVRPGSEIGQELLNNRQVTLDGERPGDVRMISADRGVASFSFSDERSAMLAVRELQINPDVLVAEIDQPRELYWEPVSEPEYDEQLQWVRQVKLPDAWNITTGADQTVVAVVDSGVSPTHPDLADKLVNGYNAVDGNDDWADIDGHGTHVAGIIAASGSNEIGTVGAAMDVRIMPIRVLAANGTISTSSIADAIYWAIDHGADVINLSLGASTPSEVERAAVVEATSAGIPVLAASGNRASQISYPASYPETISIGALDSNGNRASFSSVLSEVDIAAPGILIFSPNWSEIEGDTWTNVYKNQPVSGTSFSVAIASGTAALMHSIDPSVGPEDVREASRLDGGGFR